MNLCLMLCVWGFGGASLVQIKQVEMQSANLGFSNFVFRKDGSFYCADYWDSQVVLFDADGRLLKVIAEQGDGPGEVRKPQWLFLVENESKLLVIESRSRWSTFHTANDEFDRVVAKYQPANKWEQKDDHSLVGIFTNTSHFFVEVGINGKIRNSWGDVPPDDPDFIWTRRYATALGPMGTVLYQEGTWPEIQIYQKGRPDPTVWQLQLPQHYREPPDKPYPLRRLGFDRDKLNERIQSYSQVAEFFVLGGRYVAVLWNIHEPYEYSLDIYDVHSRARLIGNFVVPGTYVSAGSNRMYFLEERESVSAHGTDKLILHVFELKVE